MQKEPSSKNIGFIIVGIIIFISIIGSISDSGGAAVALPLVFVVFGLVATFAAKKKMVDNSRTNSSSDSTPPPSRPNNQETYRPNTEVKPTASARPVNESTKTTGASRPIPAYQRPMKASKKEEEKGFSAQMIADNARDYKLCQSCGYRVKRDVFRCPICNTIIRKQDPHSDLR